MSLQNKNYQRMERGNKQIPKPFQLTGQVYENMDIEATLTP